MDIMKVAIGLLITSTTKTNIPTQNGWGFHFCKSGTIENEIHTISVEYTRREIPHRTGHGEGSLLSKQNGGENVKRFEGRNTPPSMSEAIRIALAKIGNSEPNIGFVTTDELDEQAIHNTKVSGKYR